MDKQRLERPSQQGGSRGSPQGRGLGARRPAWGRETWVWSSGLGVRSFSVCRLPAPRCPWAASSSSEEMDDRRLGLQCCHSSGEGAPERWKAAPGSPCHRPVGWLPGHPAPDPSMLPEPCTFLDRAGRGPPRPFQPPHVINQGSNWERGQDVSEVTQLGRDIAKRGFSIPLCPFGTDSFQRVRTPGPQIHDGTQ